MFPDGQVYIGRSSGFGPPHQVMMHRFYGHKKRRAQGFGNPELDRSARGKDGYYAIRGREQQLIDFYGGVGHPRVANSIRGVAKYNLMGRIFHAQSTLY